jgi:hypothetical protein
VSEVQTEERTEELKEKAAPSRSNMMKRSGSLARCRPNTLYNVRRKIVESNMVTPAQATARLFPLIFSIQRERH